jgi:hypothetical protein
MAKQLLKLGCHLLEIQFKGSVLGEQHYRGGIGPQRFVSPDKFAHYPFDTVAAYRSSKSFRCFKTKLGFAQYRIVTVNDKVITFPSRTLLHSLSNKALVRQTATPVEAIIFRQIPLIFSDRDGVCGSTPSGRPWWTCACENRDRSGVCGWMVGMFSSCYSYGQFINKITMLRKGGKEVKEIVREGVGPRKVLLGRGLGITLTPDPSPKGRGGTR